MAAKWGDAERIAQAFAIFMLRIHPRLGSRFKPVSPEDKLTFAELMETIAKTAHERDLEKMAGAVMAMMDRFGPGGIVRAAKRIGGI